MESRDFHHGIFENIPELLGNPENPKKNPKFSEKFFLRFLIFKMQKTMKTSRI